MKKILIAVDNGSCTERIVLHGFEISQQLNAEPALLSVVDTNFMMTSGTVTTKEMIEVIRLEYVKTHNILINKYAEKKSVLSFIEVGNPYKVILEAADSWQADLIVLGTHGRTGLTHLLMGSVAEKVIRHSKKQVLVIPCK